MFTLADDEFEALERARREEPMSSFMRRLVLRYLAHRRKK
jgi:hypothetical protein